MRGIRVYVIVAATALAACGGPPGNPLPPAPSPLVSRVQIAGPAELAPGDGGQYTAVVYYADGSTEDVTRDRSWIWTSSDSSILAVSRDGVVTAQRAGEASVSGMLNLAPREPFRVLVVPRGTYRLAVGVADADLPELKVFDAVVEVRTKDGRTLTATTGSNGARFYGVEGRTEIRTTYPSVFETDIRTIDVTSHQDLNVRLKRVERPVRDLEGQYALNISASPSCAPNLPAEVRTRTYRALLYRPSPTKVLLTLFNAQFATYEDVYGNSIDGELTGNGALKFSVNDTETVAWGGKTFVQELVPIPAGTYSPSGGVMAAVRPDEIAGFLSGSIRFYALQPNSTLPAVTSCFATDHTFKLTRQ